MMKNDGFDTIRHDVDLCVVGGGLAGLCAAVSAARHGAHVAIMQERPMLGGNASSEVRMWVCGAHGPNNRETGLVEELNLENLYRNPCSICLSFSTVPAFRTAPFLGYGFYYSHSSRYLRQNFSEVK